MLDTNDTLRSVVDTTPPAAIPRTPQVCGALAALALGAAITFLTAHPVMAHALVERSDPPANRLVLRPPKEVILVFSEPVDPRRTAIRVLDQEGRQISRERFAFSPDRRTARLPMRLPGPGIYTVTWRTFSIVDLHTYEGFFTFTLGPLRPGGFTLRGGPVAGPTPWEVTVRWLMFLGAAVLTGGLVVHRFLLPSSVAERWSEEAWLAALHRRWRAATSVGAGLFLAGSSGELIGQAARTAAAADEPVRAAVISLATSDPTRGPILLKFATVLLLLVLLRHRARPVAAQPASLGIVAKPVALTRGVIELAAAGVLVLGIALTSHAAASQKPLPMLVDWLHLFSAAVWVGGLVYLGAVLGPLSRRVDPEFRSALLGPFVQRFSNLALFSVAVLILTGLYAAWLNLPELRALVSTQYGRTLSIKLALVVPLLAIAAANLIVLRPRLAEAARKALADLNTIALQRRFFRLVRSEAALASLVLLAAAVLALLPTAQQTLALGPRQEIALVRRSDTIEGVLRITPYQTGENMLELRLSNPQSKQPILGARVRFTFMPLATSVGVTFGDAEPRGDGGYVLRGTFLGARGPALITVTVRQPGQETARFLYPVEPEWIRGTPLTPPTESAALALLLQAEETMNRLRTLRQRQEITDGAGNDVITFFELVAPNAVHYRVIGGDEVVIIGETLFIKESNTWRRELGLGFTFPNYTFSNNASNVVMGPRELIDGIPTHVVTFVLDLAGANARYSVWIDQATRRIVQETMVARGHYMTIRNYDFNAPARLPVRSP